MSKLEPEANTLIEDCNVINRNGGDLDLSVTDAASLLSIAISLKRIADALSHQPAGDANVYDFLSRISERIER